MRREERTFIAGRLYRKQAPKEIGSYSLDVLKPAYLDIFIGVFIRLWGKGRCFLQ